MRVAIVANSAWAAYNFRFNLAKSIMNEGYEIIFIIPYDNNYSKKLESNFQCYNLKINPKSINLFKELRTIFNLYKTYRKVRPDVTCHFTIKLNIYGSIASSVCGIPSIANITGLGSAFIKKGLYRNFAQLLYKFSLSFSSKVFIQNKEDLNFFLEKKIISESKAELIPGSGVDLSKFTFSKVSNRKKFIFLMISRVLKDKGVYEYIEAIRILSKSRIHNSIEFQLLGEVNSSNNSAIKKIELEQWVEEGLINYLGVSDHVEDNIKESSCVVLPSYREGMPRAILEAYAVGRPCIVSNVPGCREIVEHKKNGLICKVKSAEDLAKKMVSMIELEDKTRLKYGENGRKKIERNFDEKIVINAYLKSLDYILKNEKNF